VSRSDGVLPATALLLAAMLSWPWNVALSAIEGAHAGVGAVPGYRCGAPGGNVSRPRHWKAAGAHAVLQADTEQAEERDDSGTLQSAFALLPAAPGLPPQPSNARPVRSRRSPFGPPGAPSCRLNC
jgi:hypothetical protein